jgi:Flp pilus assembly protein TadB
MKAQRISHLTAEQVAAVFKSERFCLLTDSQLAALHHRAEQLQAQQRQARIRRRRCWVAAVAVVGVLVALAPIWYVLVAVGLMALIWLALLAWLWEVGQKVMASIAALRGPARQGQQQS